jgi:hypothetical protein
MKKKKNTGCGIFFGWMERMAVGDDSSHLCPCTGVLPQLPIHTPHRHTFCEKLTVMMRLSTCCHINRMQV